MRSLSQLYSTAFVTGASAGIGRAFTEMLLAEGVRVWGTARDAGRLAEMATRFPALFTPVVLDLSAPAAAEAAFRRAANSADGAFDLMINNAGYGVFGRFDATDFAIWENQMNTMISTTLRLAHVAVSGMRERRRGCLVNVSSLAAEFPLPFMAGYNVAKSALSAFSESLYIETREVGVTVIDFRPGDFRTDFNRAMQSASPLAPALAPREAAAWRALEKNLAAAPSPSRAAADLRRALLKGRSGTVRSGHFFQATLAPLIVRVLPAALRRWALARYFGL